MTMRSMRLGVLLGLLARGLCLAAEEERAADHAELVALREKFVAAMSARDMDALASCFADQFVFTALDQSTVRTREEMRALYARMFTAPDAPLRDVKTSAEADGRTRFLDADTGIVSGSGRDAYTLKSGGVSTFDYRWTATVHREGGTWKVVAAHIGTSFIDNPYLHGLAGFWKKVAAGALIGGLLAGFLAGRIGRRAAKG